MEKLSTVTDTAVQCGECFNFHVRVEGMRCPHCYCKEHGHDDGGGFCRRCEAVLPMQPRAKK